MVNLVEELGAEAYLYAQLADHLDASVTATSDSLRGSTRMRRHDGELVHLRVREGSHLFDTASGARITGAR